MPDGFQVTPYGRFASNYYTAKLEQICVPKTGIQTGPFGSQLHKEDYVSTGTPIITVEHLGDNFILHDSIPCVSDEDRDRLSRYLLREGDIVFSRVGSVDRRALVRSEEDGWLFSGRCLRVRPNVEVIDSKYLSYFFSLPSFQEHIRAIAVGATMPSLNTKILSNVEIFFPTIKQQRAIAHILGTLDDKIELNRRMNETLEAIARAIFKSWFVDFDPVRAKAEGRNPGLPKHIADLFPDSFEDSEIGEIPMGWELTTLADKILVIKGRSYKSSELIDSDTALVTLKSFARGGGYRQEGLKSYSGPFKQEQIVEPGELLFACTDVTQAAEVIGRPAIVRGNNRFDTLVASLDTLIARPKSEAITTIFLYFLGSTDAFTAHMYAHTTGTTVLHLAKEAFPSFKYPQPPIKLIQEFSKKARLFLQRIDSSEGVSEILNNLRDTLLPKLISGQVRIKDIDRILERVD